jgi:hypothetical protein
MYYAIHGQMKKMLGQLSTWLDLADAFAKTKGFDSSTLLTARLAPDQFAFARQVQSACDNAKFTAARLTGKDAPSHPDNEKTIDELRARIRSTIAYLDTFTASDYDGAATRIVTNPRWEGKVQVGSDYVMEYGLPNFFFHVTHAYAILRHNGVDLGKRHYLGAQSRRDP